MEAGTPRKPQDNSGTLPLTTVPSEVAARNLINRVDPVYPAMPGAAGVTRRVKFAITVTEAGTVTDVALISGHPMLVLAAKQAVLAWRYKPFTENGNPVRVRLVVDLPFSLADVKENDCRAAAEVHQYSLAEPACRDAVALADQHPKERTADRAMLHQTYGLVLEAEQKYKEALPEFQEELAISEKMPNSRVMVAFAERDAAGAYQSTGDTGQALTHYRRAEHEMRDARKHGETPQIKDARGRTLKQILEKHAALLDQMGHGDEAAALRREASEM